MRDTKKAIPIERWDVKIPVDRLLPNALLSSPIFDFEDMIPQDKKNSEILMQDNFEDAL